LRGDLRMKKEFIIAIMGIFVTISAVYAVIATAPIGVDIAKEKVHEYAAYKIRFKKSW
jgi:uncharacterized membrane protein YccF (DUF307 family)